MSGSQKEKRERDCRRRLENGLGRGVHVVGLRSGIGGDERELDRRMESEKWWMQVKHKRGCRTQVSRKRMLMLMLKMRMKTKTGTSSGNNGYNRKTHG